MEKRPMDRETRERKRRTRAAWKKVWHIARPILVIAVSLCICYVLLSKVTTKVLDKFLFPVDPADATPVTVTVASGSGASAIAKLLYEAGGTDDNDELLSPGLIKSKAVFKVYVDFTGKSSKLRAGTYVLSRNMDIPQIVDIICEGNPPKATVRFTITEGSDVEAVAAKLIEQGVLKDDAEFLSLCKSGDAFTDYAFVKEILDEQAQTGQARDYVLEGYLFPDTYEVYADASAKTIINKMLMQFLAVFSDEYIARAQELDMSTDDVVKLAALIEKEAKVGDDFAKVSAVFHNRLKADMPMESDASLRYIFKQNILNWTQTQRQDESPYNTIVYKGLGLGPITNPGRRAIEAALYPDEAFVEEEYLFFVLKYGWTGELAYAKTNEAHDENVAQYSQYWAMTEKPADFKEETQEDD
ncbi:MAG: endolytic transglycosylase MltG [Clostridia bacterium]|nr:endolytic transglycosylase MltG [Clostridia bacterium]